MNKTNIVIIGSGPAGWTAAIYAARANLSPVIITGNNKGGQLNTTTDVENWPGGYIGLQGPELMEDMEKQAKNLNVKIIEDEVISVKLKRKPFQVKTELGKSFQAQAIIIATGASAKYLGLESEAKFLGKGVSACATCDGFFYKNQDVVVVGGGNTAVEEALYLSQIAKKVTLIHRRDTLRAEPILQDRLFTKIKSSNIDIIWNHQLVNIAGHNNQVSNIDIEDTITKSIKNISCSGVFIAIGHKPNTDLFYDLAMDNNYIIIGRNNHNMKTMTSIPGVFAAGDVTDQIYRQAITSAGSGCMAALDAHKYLESNI